MALAGALFFGFVPMFLYAAFVNWLDRFEKEPKVLLGATFLWGVVIAAGGAFLLNTTLAMGIYIITGSEHAADIGTTSIVAPIIEEALKGLAVLIIFVMFRREFDSILDGIVYAGIAAMGFAAVENTLYIYRNGFLDGGWHGFWTLVLIRVILIGSMHPFFTAFTGIGVAIARLSRNVLVKIIAIPGGYTLAVLAHAFHNTFSNLVGGNSGFFIGLVADYFGYACMFGFIVWMIINERNILKRQLVEEVNNGLLSPKQYKSAISFFQTGAHLTALISGTYCATARFYRVCGELANKKEHLAKIGDENGNGRIVEQLRMELVSLAPMAKA